MLTDKGLRALRPRDKLYRVADQDGLCIEVTPAGKKLLAVPLLLRQVRTDDLAGSDYPGTSLAQARELRDEQRRLLRSGVDPTLKRKADRLTRNISQANTFEAVGRAWLEKMKSEWMPDQLDKVMCWLEHHIFPWLGPMPIAEIEAPVVLAVLQRLVKRGTLNTAGRVRQVVSRIFLRHCDRSGQVRPRGSPGLRPSQGYWAPLRRADRARGRGGLVARDRRIPRHGGRAQCVAAGAVGLLPAG
ncbi:phage integrase central domain-containing protein [Pseudoxanthomonas broegbernensis]|uniref:tyrosine-type recombinase/integrase n=1 Tax=Pseudoxanthomonas broegbernensis TaxID=83619 RepID=UPI001B886DBD